MIYLDYAAATPLDDQVLDAMRPYFAENFYNPSATYLAARGVRRDLEEARARIAQVLGARPVEIIFTAGATEANNLAVRGVMERFPTGNIVVSGIEHDSVLEPSALYERRLAPVGPDGRIDIVKLAELIDDNTVLVSVMYANNEVGTIQPLGDIAEMIRSKRSGRAGDMPLYFHTDAAQAANYLDMHISRLGVDLMSINGGKIYGPKQSGALFISANVQLKPQILGGGQERGLRNGTENVASSIGLAKALEMAQANRRDESERLLKLRQDFSAILQQEISQVIINGSLKHRLPNNLHVTIAGQDNERLLMELDERGILAAAGSACSASSEEPSHVLKAMGISESDAQSSLRFSFGRQTNAEELKKVAEILSSLV